MIEPELSVVNPGKERKNGKRSSWLTEIRRRRRKSDAVETAEAEVSDVTEGMGWADLVQSEVEGQEGRFLLRL